MCVQSDPCRLLAEAEAACARNDHRSGAALARRVIDQAAASGDALSLARARTVLAQACIDTGEFESASRLARLALDHATVHGPPLLLAQACNVLSFVHDRAGLAALAVEHGTRALEAARICGDRLSECLALNRLGVALRDPEESARAIALLEDSVRLARTLPTPGAAFRPLNNLASRWISEADRLIEFGRDPRAALYAARASAQEAEAIALATGLPLQQAMINANLAAIHRRLGEYDCARRRFVAAIDLARAEGAFDHEKTFRLALSSLEVEANPSPAGCAALERHLDAFPAAVSSDLLVRARRILARAYSALGDGERACTQWERIHTESRGASRRRADAPPRLPQTPGALPRARQEAHIVGLEADASRLPAAALAVPREVARLNERLESDAAGRTADLQQALLAAEAASLAKSAFLACVSQELGAPLDSVLANVELARGRGSDPHQHRQLDRALASGRELASLLEHLLAYVADSVPGCSVAEDTAVRELVGDALLLAQRNAPARAPGPVIEVADDVPQRVGLDAGRVRRVLATLIGYALRSGAEVPAWVTVHRSRGASGTGEVLVFTVLDRGPEIPQAVLSHLFAMFESGRPPTPPQHRRLALGLALVGRWTEAMGARIDVDRDPARGNRFMLSVPVDAAPSGTDR